MWTFATYNFRKYVQCLTSLCILVFSKAIITLTQILNALSVSIQYYYQINWWFKWINLPDFKEFKRVMFKIFLILLNIQSKKSIWTSIKHVFVCFCFHSTPGSFQYFLLSWDYGSLVVAFHEPYAILRLNVNHYKQTLTLYDRSSSPMLLRPSHALGFPK